MQPHPVIPKHYQTPEQKPTFVRNLFDAGAPYYDRVVGAGFFGSGLRYRRAAQRRAGLRAGMKLLDVAAGTGLMARAAIGLGVKPEDVLCLDPSPGMLAVAKQKLSVETVVGSADALPLPDRQFDFITMGFALRHVASLESTFREYHRVLRPGGRVLVLEITKPTPPLEAWLFKLWFRTLYPWFTRLITFNRDAQRMMSYYWETMDAVVTPPKIMEAMRVAGFSFVRRRVVGRVFSEYSATRPAE